LNPAIAHTMPAINISVFLCTVSLFFICSPFCLA
jgi:hypothetical protein